MARVLILTTPDDVHAAAVTCVLERRDHEVVTLYGPDLPTALTASVEIGAAAPSIALDGVDLGAIDSVWMRRPSRPVLPDDMHPADRPIAARELDAFVKGLHDLLAPRAFWVNPVPSLRRAASKLVQLDEARAAGLTIPRTLVSTDPARIRSFVRAHRGDVVYKPLRPSLWTGADGRVSPMTTVVDEDMLPDDDILRLVPGIFQPRVRKRHELRATFLGDHVVTARIHSQDDPALRVDWRAGGGRPPLELDALPPAVEARCRDVMRRLGIVFGCIDLIVTPEGDHVFLEVNEAGQWLWIEEALPETRLLDRFAAMLAQARPDPSGTDDPVAFEDVVEDAVARVADAVATHVQAAADHVVAERDDVTLSPPDTREACSPT